MKKFFIGVVILLTIFCVGIGIYYTVRYVKNIESKKFLDYTYVTYATTEILENEELNSTRLLFTFDENDICVLSRFVWDFKTEDIAQKNYQNWKECGMSNLKINGTKVSFNDVEQVGKTKNEIENGFNGFDIRLEY